MSSGAALLWVVVPYCCLLVFVVGHAWRYRQDRFGWTTRSTQLLERRLLRWGSLLLHIGLLAAVGGHVLGLLVPKGVTRSVGISESAYHVISVAAGGTSGAAIVLGFAILAYRRARVPRVRARTTRGDLVTYALLGLVVASGTAATLGWNLIGGGYDYRATVAPWLRSLLTFGPDPAHITGAPLIYQLHALSAFALLAWWPFSRLVHVWSVPVQYLLRAPIVYRARVPRPAVAAELPATASQPRSLQHG